MADPVKETVDQAKLAQMLKSEDRGLSLTSGTSGILSRLFRIILLDLNIDMFKWGSLMNDYLLNPANRVPDNNRDRTSMRGNLNKEFTLETMTWKVFTKALRFIQAYKMDFTVTLYRRGRVEKTSHTVSVEFYQTANNPGTEENESRDDE